MNALFRSKPKDPARLSWDDVEELERTPQGWRFARYAGNVYHLEGPMDAGAVAARPQPGEIRIQRLVIEMEFGTRLERTETYRGTPYPEAEYAKLMRQSPRRLAPKAPRPVEMAAYIIGASAGTVIAPQPSRFTSPEADALRVAGNLGSVGAYVAPKPAPSGIDAVHRYNRRNGISVVVMGEHYYLKARHLTDQALRLNREYARVHRGEPCDVPTCDDRATHVLAGDFIACPRHARNPEA